MGIRQEIGVNREAKTVIDQMSDNKQLELRPSSTITVQAQNAQEEHPVKIVGATQRDKIPLWRLSHFLRA